MFDKKFSSLIGSILHHFKGDVEKSYYYLLCKVQELPGFVLRQFEPAPTTTPTESPPGQAEPVADPVSPVEGGVQTPESPTEPLLPE